MEPSAAARFAAGAGVDAATLKAAAVAFVAVAILLWAGWVSQGLYSQWRNERIGGLTFAAGAIRACVLALLVVYFIH
jgi:integrating conjugative element protein (TIGR03758 family)